MTSSNFFNNVVIVNSKDNIDIDEVRIKSTTSIKNDDILLSNIVLSKPSEGFFYIIQTPDVEPNVYKIGKTIQSNPNKRLCVYPKFSIVKYTIFVKDADGFEDYVMRKMRTLFKRRKEYGLEYYEGDIIKIIDLVHNLWMKFGQVEKISNDTENEKIKPVGWQVFVNEWLCHRSLDNINPDEAYEAYVKIVRDDFQLCDFALKYPFTVYLKHCLE